MLSQSDVKENHRNEDPSAVEWSAALSKSDRDDLDYVAGT